jgi:formamidopyrimidine-DNA glycosylase
MEEGAIGRLWIQAPMVWQDVLAEVSVVPELPEVETVRRDLLAAGVIGERITGATVLWERTLGGLAAQDFTSALINRMFTSIDRRGKYLVFTIDDGQRLLVHLRMSGSLELSFAHEPVDAHDRIIISFSSRQLRFHDPRKFGRMILTRDPREIIGKLGPEPFSEELDHERFFTLLQPRRGSIKALLLDQRFIAGIGNIYADESLFTARIHPQRTACSLSRQEASRLLKSIRTHLEDAIEHRGTSLGAGEGNFASDGRRGGHGTELFAFRRTGLPCPVCGTPIARMVISQRSTHYCPLCQT